MKDFFTHIALGVVWLICSFVVSFTTLYTTSRLIGAFVEWRAPYWDLSQLSEEVRVGLLAFSAIGTFATMAFTALALEGRYK